MQPSWSPHGHRIAYWGMVGESAQRDLWTIDPAAAEPEKSVVRVTDDAAIDWNPVWSADGQHLYFGSDRSGAMSLWRIAIDEESGKPRPVLDGTFLIFSSQVSPDGRFVAVTNRGGQEDLFVVEVATGDIRQLTNDIARDRGPTWSPDGARIYFYSQRSENRYEIWRINADGSGLTQITTTTGRSVWYPNVSPDGKRLAFFNDEHTYLLDLARLGAELEPLPAAMQGSRPAFNAWSPDGTMLAGELRGRQGVVIYSLTERTYRPVTSTGARPMIWLPSGREVLYADAGKLRIVNIDTGAIRDVVTTAPIIGASLSADGKTLVYSDREMQGDIWMASPGPES